MRNNILRKQISIEETLSRIPSLFPYIEYDEFGISHLHSANDSVNGAYGKIIDSLKMPCTITTDGDVYIPYSYTNDEINYTVSATVYNEQLYNTKYVDYSPCEYLLGKEYRESEMYKYYNEFTDINNTDGYIAYEFALKMQSAYDDEVFINGVLTIGEYFLLGHKDRYLYTPFLYNKKILASEITEEVLDSGFAIIWEYINTTTGKIITVEDYALLNEEEQSEYEIYTYIDNRNAIKSDDLTPSMTEYTPTYFYSRSQINLDVYNTLTSEEQNNCTPFLFLDGNCLKTNEELVNVDECDRYKYFPYKFKHNETGETIYLDDYKNLGMYVKDSYRVDTFISTYTMVTKTVDEYKDFVAKNCINNGEPIDKDKIYVIQDYYNVKTNEIISADEYLALDESQQEDYFPHTLRKIILYKGVYYSYRTLITAYYSLKNELPKDNPFIKFMEDAIGYIKIEDAVERYNTEFLRYERICDDLITDEGVETSVFDYLLNNDVVSLDSNDDVVVDGNDIYVAILYKNGDEIIYNNEYHQLEEEKQNDFAPYKYIRVTSVIDSNLDINITPLPVVYVKVGDIDNGNVYSYVNINDDSDVIRVDKFNRLSEYSQSDYVPSYYVNKYDDTDEITAEEYSIKDQVEQLNYIATRFIVNIDGEDVEMSYEEIGEITYKGKNEYVPYKYYDVNTTISYAVFNQLTEEEKAEYRIFAYSFNNSDLLVEADEYDTALYAYSKLLFEPWQYYRIYNVSVIEDSSDSGDIEDETIVEYDIISLEEYNALTHQAIKDTYDVYTYSLINNDNVIISYEDWDKLPYLCKSDYSVFRYLYKSKVKLDGFSGEPISFKDDQYLVPEEIYLATVRNLLDTQLKLKRRCDRYLQNNVVEDKVKCCECIEFYLRGYNDIILIYKMLVEDAKRIAEQYYLAALSWLSDENYKHSQYSFNIALSGTQVDNGYLTTYENVWKPGDYVAYNEEVVYTDENGTTNVYRCTKEDGTFGIYNDETFNIDFEETAFEPEDYHNSAVVTHGTKNNEDEYIIVKGKTDSKLTECRMLRDYINEFETVEITDKYTDWLFYYRLNYVVGTNVSHDSNGNILFIGEDEPKIENGYVVNLDAFGNIITSIECDKEEHTITFKYVTGAHLKSKLPTTFFVKTQYCKIDSIDECITQNEYENLGSSEEQALYYENIIRLTEDEYDQLSAEEQSGYTQQTQENPYVDSFGKTIYAYTPFEYDDSSEYGKHCGVKYTETYIYDNGGELDNLLNAYDFKNEFVFVEGNNSYVKQIDQEKYDSLPESEQSEYVYVEVEVENTTHSYYEKIITPEKFYELDFCCFEDYINNSELFDFKKYEFSKYENVGTYTLEIGCNTIDVEYIIADYEYYVKTIPDNTITLPIFKMEHMNGVHYKEEVNADVRIERGNATAFERHLRLGEVKTLNDMMDYRNGSFFNVQTI